MTVETGGAWHEGPQARGGGEDPAHAARIVEVAVATAAERGGWSRLRLHEVADRMGISLAELRHYYRDADEIADAWLDRGDRAMLEGGDPGSDAGPPAERIHAAMMRWMDALAPYRRVTAEMLGAKMWPFHPQHNVALLFRLSRTVQWLREAAHLDGGAPRRQVEEIGLTWLFAGTIAFWALDDSPGQARTRDQLRRRLEDADRLMARTFGREGLAGRGGGGLSVASAPVPPGPRPARRRTAGSRPPPIASL